MRPYRVTKCSALLKAVYTNVIQYKKVTFKNAKFQLNYSVNTTIWECQDGIRLLQRVVGPNIIMISRLLGEGQANKRHIDKDVSNMNRLSANSILMSQKTISAKYLIEYQIAYSRRSRINERECGQAYEQGWWYRRVEVRDTSATQGSEVKCSMTNNERSLGIRVVQTQESNESLEVEEMEECVVDCFMPEAVTVG